MRAYNDFLTDWCSADPERLLPVIATPFWDLEFAVAEIERAAAAGHRAVNMCSQPQNYGEPPLGSSATGTRSGPRPATPACRSASTSAAVASATS